MCWDIAPNFCNFLASILVNICLLGTLINSTFTNLDKTFREFASIDSSGANWITLQFSAPPRDFGTMLFFHSAFSVLKISHRILLSSCTILIIVLSWKNQYNKFLKTVLSVFENPDSDHYHLVKTLIISQPVKIPAKTKRQLPFPTQNSQTICGGCTDEKKPKNETNSAIKRIKEGTHDSGFTRSKKSYSFGKFHQHMCLRHSLEVLGCWYVKNYHISSTCFHFRNSPKWCQFVR